MCTSSKTSTLWKEVWLSPLPGLVVASLFAGIGWWITHVQDLEQHRRHFEASNFIEIYDQLYGISCLDINATSYDDLEQMISALGKLSIVGSETHSANLTKFLSKYAELRNSDDHKRDRIPFRYLLVPTKDNIFEIHPEDSLLLSIKKYTRDELGMQEDQFVWPQILVPPQCHYEKDYHIGPMR